MFLLFPVNVGEARVRVPLAAALVAVVCVGAFLPTWALAEDPLSEERFRAVMRYWDAHRALSLDARFVSRALEPEDARRCEVLGALAREALEAAPPDPEVRAREQRYLDGLVAEWLAHETWLRRLALVPARGLLQPGWLTAMFLHFGWLHLLGNLFFLWLAAPLLEDAWGRARFAGVYLASGLAAAAAHALVELDSTAVAAGASGAISGLMGAFAVRFPRRRLSIAYLVYGVVFIRRGLWRWPAWFAAALWVATQAWDAVGGSTGGVAVSAHLGGFGFGAVVALVMKALGLDRELVTTDEGAVDLTRRHVSKGVEAARAALEVRDAEGAKRLLEAALTARPTDTDARLLLAELELATPGREDVAHKHFLRAVTEASTASPTHGAELWHEYGPRFGAQRLTPAQALRLARVVAASPEPAVAQSALGLFERAAEAPGLLGQQAGLEAARRRWAEARDGSGARDALECLLAQPTLPAALASEARLLLEQLPEQPPRSGLELDDRRHHAAPGLSPGATSSLELDDRRRHAAPGHPPSATSGLELDDRRSHAAPGHPPGGTSGLELDDRRRHAAPGLPPDDREGDEAARARAGDLPAVEVQVLGLSEGVLRLGHEGGERVLPLATVEALGAGVVPMGTGKVLVVELFSPLAPPLRLVSTTANLQGSRRAESAKALYRDFLLEVLALGATPLFDRAALEAGHFPGYPSLEAYEAARADARRRMRLTR